MSADLKRSFLKFHKENPRVFKELRRLALDLLKQGHTHWGISALWEVMRYNFMVDKPGVVAKFPNNHRAYYARALMLLEPRLVGFFTLCELRSGAAELTIAELQR